MGPARKAKTDEASAFPVEMEFACERRGAEEVWRAASSGVFIASLVTDTERL